MDAATLPEGTRAVLEDFGIELTEDQLRGFAGHVDAFAASGLPFWVCPGTSTWNTLIGRLHNARGNLLDAAKTGLARGASGYLITDWGDNGHLQPPSVSLPPLVYGAAVAWCADANRDLEIAPLLDRFVLRDDAGVLGTALETLGDLYGRTGKLAFNASPLFTDLVRSGGLGSMGQPDPDRVAGVLRTLDEVRACLADARPGCEDGATVVRELRQAARLARHGAWRIARAAGLERPADGDLERDLADAIEEQRACWLLRSRPGGLDDSVARLERTRADYSA
jgi:hexosaminidase